MERKPKLILKGQVFGQLTVVEDLVPKRKCLCSCGKETYVKSQSLKSGHTKSCGCLGLQALKEGRETHRLTGSYNHELWMRMKARCYYTNKKYYKKYKENKIGVHEDWRTDFESFNKYLNEVLGPRPENYTLDRIDNKKDYEPGNIRWASSSEQCQNRNCYNPTGYQGVTKDRKKFVAQITTNYRYTRLGRFDTAEEAALAYNQAALKYFGPNAKLNKI